MIIFVTVSLIRIQWHKDTYAGEKKVSDLAFLLFTDILSICKKYV